MLIPPSKLKSFWGIVPTGVVHVGTHRGEEIEDYELNSFGPVIWIEAQPDLFQYLEEPRDRLTTIGASESRFKFMLARGLLGAGAIDDISEMGYQTTKRIISPQKKRRRYSS